MIQLLPSFFGRWISAVAAVAVSALLAGSSLALAAAPSLVGSRPNIIVVLTDDQGYGELGCHGNRVIQTPNLDRLHAASLRFTHFHVSPTCAPTRAALLTGRHEFRSGVTHTIFERERLSLGATTLPQMLRAAGYATGIFGKWHLGDEDAYQPDRRGFDEVFIHGGGGIGQTYPGSCGDAPGNRYFDPAIRHNDRFEMTHGYCTDVFFTQALKWIDERRRTGSPFFCYLTPNAPHDPFVAPGDEWEAPYRGRGLGTNAIRYYAMIANIDANVGRLLARLHEWNLETNTLVIFMTDNGHSVPDVFNAGMRGMKNTPYEGGTRVPSFWHWPGVLAEGVDCDRLAAHVDVLPTLLELAGAGSRDLPALDGRSLVPLLRDPKAAWPDRLLFTHTGRWESGHAAGHKFRGCAVTSARFKLVNDTELFDLEADPGEARNVIAGHPEVLAQLRAAYERWWAEVLPSALESDDAVGPYVNPFKQRYWEQFGGPRDEWELQRMDPALKFQWPRPPL
jgi:arylsulfatase